jgi:amino acid transporter
MILSCISIARDGEWTAARGTIYGVFAGLVVVHGLCAIFAGPIMPKIQTACIYINLIIMVATVIALPVGKVTRTGSLNPGSYVFGHIDNLTNWPTGWSFVLAWLSPIWSIGFFDSCVHMSEEALHAAKAVPLGIIWSAGTACVLGFLVISIIASVMNQNISHTLNSAFGQPMAQVSCSRGYGNSIDKFRYTLTLWESEARSVL